MNWTELQKLAPLDFINKISRRPANLMKYSYFIDLYNSLMKHCDVDPAHSAALAAALSPFLRKRGLQRHAILFDELSARAYIINGEFSKACKAMSVMLEADQGTESRKIVFELAEGIAAHSHTFGMSVDQRPEVLAAVCTIFSQLGERECLADAHLKAAVVYSHHGAFQAAYRSISDAEEIAHEIGSLSLLARTLVQAASVACFERDYKWSLATAEKALSIYKELDTEPPPGFLSNFALAQLHTNKIDDALQNFRLAAQAANSDPLTVAQVQLNIATCLRLKGEFDEAEQVVDSSRELLSSNAPFEARVELEIVSARLALMRRDYEDVASHLKAAVQWFDEGLADVFRLHHRRGLREQYIERLEGILRELPACGRVDMILPVMATIRGNALGDWLILLDWVDFVLDADILTAEKEALKRIMHKLRGFGAPHLYGYSEKYDDAWEPGNKGKAWDDLSKLARQLAKRVATSPFEGARLTPTVDRLQRRLAERHAFVTVTYSGPGVMMWILFGDQYVRVQLPDEALSRWRNAQVRHSVGELSRGECAQALQNLLEIYGPLLQSALSELAAFEPSSIKFLRDFDGNLPFVSIILGNERLGSAIAKGMCEIRIVPALVLSQENNGFPPQTIAAICEPSDDLLLPRFEGEAVASAAGIALESIGTSKTRKSLQELLGNAESLIVSTHGQPLAFFTDAIFAGMGEGHVINVGTLQAEAAELKLKLVILNACYSGTASGRNFQKGFRTSDAVTLPSLFLLNRQAVVAASLWKVSDAVSYIYATLIGSALKRGISPALAISSSVAAVKRLTKSEAIELLKKILDPDVRAIAIKRLSNAPEIGLFSDPYLYGAFALFGLL